MISERIVEALLGDDDFDPKDEIGRMRETDPHAFDVPTLDKLDAFTLAYLEAAFFTEEDRLKEEAEENGLDPDEHDFDWSPEAIMKAHDDCNAFRTERTVELLDEAGAKDDVQNGHDFWYTRNHHGVGFWDRGYEDEYADALTEIAHKFGEVFTYLGDDGLIYMQ